MAHDVFISYSGQDRNVADAVCHALEADKIRCWYAPRNIPAGADWPAAIMQAIADCRVMVYVLTAHSKMSKEVTREVQHAFSKGKTVIPFRLEEITATPSLEYYLEHVHWLNAFPPPFEGYLASLVNHVKLNLAAPGTESEEVQRQQAADAKRKDQDAQLLKDGEKLFAEHQRSIQFASMTKEQIRDLHLEGYSFENPDHWAGIVTSVMVRQGISIPTIAWFINHRIAERKKATVGWTSLAVAVVVGIFAVKQNSFPVFLVSSIALAAGILMMWRIGGGARYFNFANPTSIADQLKLAKLYEDAREFPTAFGWYLKAAEKGDQTGIWKVARWYEDGVGLSRDPEAAARWRATPAKSGFLKNIG